MPAARAFLLGAALVLLPPLAFVVTDHTVYHFERRNHFCVSCHLHEHLLATFEAGAEAARDLAAAHFAAMEAPRCIECHKGEGLGKNINYVMVYGMKGDAVANTYGEATVAYALQAPAKPGEYTLAAVLLYGTEKASPLATVKKVGANHPLGGFAGASGRILFTEPHTVKVTP